MSNGIITKQDLITEDALQFGEEYARNVQTAIDKNEELKKSALGLFEVYKQLKSVNNEKDFKASQEQQISLSQKGLKAYEDQTKALKATSTAWKEQDQLEKNLISTKKKNALATESTNRALQKERQSLNETNREIRASLSTMGKLVLARDKARKSVQEYQAKLAFGEKLSNKEQKELAESTIAFNKYDKAVRSIKESTNQFQENVGNYPKQFKAIGAGIKSLIPALGIIGVLKYSFDFLKESRDVAIQAKGVEFAFERLGDVGVDAFERVKKSTRGTLSDLDIKTALVDFDNFNISLEETDTLFEFLAVRAAQTGKSVEELQSSLVEGLSKESKLRIDNLGISTAVLNDELKKTPNFVKAVANIAKTEIARAGNILDEAGNSQSRWNADLKNFQLLIGNGLIAKASDSLYSFGSNILRAITPTKTLVTEIQNEQVELNILVGKITDVNISNEERTKLIESLKEKYPSFLKFLKDEKTDNESLGLALRQINDQYIKRIALQIQQERIEKVLTKAGEKAYDVALNQVKIEKELARINTEVLNSSLDLTNKSFEQRVEIVQKALDKEALFIESKSGFINASNKEARALESLWKLTGRRNGALKDQKELTEELTEEQEQMNALEIALGGTLEQINELFKENDAVKTKVINTTKTLTEEEEKALKAAQKMAEERRKLLKEDRNNLEKTILQQSIDAEKLKVDNTKSTTGQRLSANIDYYNKSVALLDFEKSHAISNAQGRKNELERIQLEYNDDIAKLEKQRSKTSEAILQEAFEKAKKRIDEKKKLEEAGLNQDISKLQSQLQEQLAVEGISTSERFRLIKKYEDDVLELKQESAKKQLQVKIDAIERELEINKALDPEQRIALEQILADAKIALNNEVTENDIANAQKIAEAELKNQELLKDTISTASQSIADSLSLDAQNIESLFDSFLTKAVETGNEIIDKYNKVSHTIAQIGSVTAVTGDIFQSIFDANIEKIDDAIDANDTYYDRLYERAEGDKEQQDLLREEQEQKRLELEEKKKKEQIKAAKFAKAQAIFEIAVNTAIAVSKSLAQGGFVLGIPMSIVVAALGALQIGAVLAKPIPKYELGTDYHPGGLAEVAEKRPEVIHEPNKRPYIQHDRAVLKLAKGTKVYSSVEEFESMKRAAILTGFQSQKQQLNSYETEMAFNYNNDDVVKKLEELKKTIRDNKTSVRVQQSKQIDLNYEIFKFKNTNFS